MIGSPSMANMADKCGGFCMPAENSIFTIFELEYVIVKSDQQFLLSVRANFAMFYTSCVFFD